MAGRPQGEWISGGNQRFASFSDVWMSQKPSIRTVASAPLGPAIPLWGMVGEGGKMAVMESKPLRSSLADKDRANDGAVKLELSELR